MEHDEGRKQNENRKLTHTPLPILWGLKALITEAAERASRVVTEPMAVTHSVVYTFINICKRDTGRQTGNKTDRQTPGMEWIRKGALLYHD